MTSTSLLKTTEGREELKYLVSCALPKKQELYATYDDKEYVFKGSMGLAPKWLHNGLAKEEQHWISACILARTNYFGQPIEISMRSDSSNFAALKTDKAEEEEFSLFEGGFFGNIFLEEPVAYVCQGDIKTKDKILKWRVCAKSSKSFLPSGEELSMCDFVIVGKCGNSHKFKVSGEEYKEVIKVYLKPGLSSVKRKE